MDNFNQIKSEIMTVSDASAQLIDFYDRNSLGKKVVFPIDYSLISGFVRPRTQSNPALFDRGFDRDIDHIGRRIFQLYEDHAESTPYKIAFSEPTIIEFESAASHLKSELTTILRSTPNDLDRTYNSVMRFIDSHFESSRFINPDLLKTGRQAFNVIRHAFGDAQLESLFRLIKSGHVQGLGSYYNREDFEKKKAKIFLDTKNIWDYLNKYRSQAGLNYFNNLIDALNFSLTYHLNQIKNDVTLSYVAPFPSISRDGKFDSAFPGISELVSRRAFPATLLLDLSARHFMANTKTPDVNAKDWILTCFDRAKICRKYVKNATSANDLAEPRQREVNLFYKEYMQPTFRPGRDSKPTQDSFDEARTLFSDRNAFRRRFEESAENAQSIKAHLDSLEPLISSTELLSDLGLSDDPRILNIRSKFDRY